MSRGNFFEIVKSELEISGISDMSIEEEVKSSKKEFWVSLNFGFEAFCQAQDFVFFSTVTLGPGRLVLVRGSQVTTEVWTYDS